MAVTQQRADPVALGRGMWISRSLNCMVLLHCTITITPHVKKRKSVLTNCLEASNEDLPFINRCDLRNIAKNATRHIAQKETSTLHVRFNLVRMSRKILTVIGCFVEGNHLYIT